jgi:predicted phage terminase large subunit-like protein
MTPLQLRNTVLREDFVSFVHRGFLEISPGTNYNANWTIEVIADRLKAVADGRNKRLIINMPPRSLKSFIASVAFPAWVLGHNPSARIICISYGQDLAGKFARDCRRIMETDWYKAAFPGTRINPRKSAEEEFETTASGYRLSSSITGGLTGRGGQLIIIDDPLKPGEALSDAIRGSVNERFDNTIYSRLDNKTTDAIIVVQQRVHENDLTGHLLAKGSWTQLMLPAIATETERFTLDTGRTVGRKVGQPLDLVREPIEVLDDMRVTIGSYIFEAQYQQTPIPPEGNMIKPAWFRWYDTCPDTSEGSSRIIQSWDTALSTRDSADYTVCTTWMVQGQNYYLIDVSRGRMNFPDLKRAVVDTRDCFGANVVLIEASGAGQALIQQLNEDDVVRPIAIRPQLAKAERMAAQSASIEAGQVWLPTNKSWLDEFIKEVQVFPSGRHDDQVDSMSQFLEWIEKSTQFDAPIAIASIPRQSPWLDS